MVEPPLEPEDRLTPEAFGPVAWRLILELAETHPALARRLRREGVLSEESADALANGVSRGPPRGRP